LGAIYTIGYLIEMKLKALAFKGKKKVAHIHDLRELWERCGFKITDVKGPKRVFLESWCVSLRYQAAWPTAQMPTGVDYELMRRGAMELSGYIQAKIRYT
jgi:hypothetical protein